jgi:hypothetical protein
MVSPATARSRYGGYRRGLLAIDGFAAVAAIGGGLALVTGLEADRFPVSWLDGTPFSSYVVPGLILAVLVGGSAALAALETWFHPAIGAWASIIAGLVMSGWIVGEIRILTAEGAPPSASEILYFTVGLGMVLLGGALGRARDVPSLHA